MTRLFRNQPNYNLTRVKIHFQKIFPTCRNQRKKDLRNNYAKSVTWNTTLTKWPTFLTIVIHCVLHVWDLTLMKRYFWFYTIDYKYVNWVDILPTLWLEINQLNNQEIRILESVSCVWTISKERWDSKEPKFDVVSESKMFGRYIDSQEEEKLLMSKMPIKNLLKL